MSEFIEQFIHSIERQQEDDIKQAEKYAELIHQLNYRIYERKRILESLWKIEYKSQDKSK